MSVNPKRHSSDWAVGVGMGAGVAAGAALLLVELALTVVEGGSLTGPFRLAATIALGPAALSRTYPLPLVLALGTGIQGLLGMIFGLIAILVLVQSRGIESPLTRLLAASAAYGALIWAINYLIVAPVAFPQFMALGLLWPSLATHVVAFGLVLGGFVAWSRARYN